MNKIEKINLESAANTPIIKDLKALLNSLSIQQLKYTGDLFFVNRLSNKRKKELVQIIYNTITNKDKLMMIIHELIDEEYELLNLLMKNKGTLQNNNIKDEAYHYLYMTGIVFLFRRENKFYISMTDDVYKVIEQIDLSKFKTSTEKNTKAYNLLKAMVELYGVVSEDDYIQTYNKYYDYVDYQDIPWDTLRYCPRPNHINLIFNEEDDYYISNLFEKLDMEENIDVIIQRQKEVERKSITLKELLKYADYTYYEPNEDITSYKKFLKSKKISNDTIDEMLLTINKLFKLGHSSFNTVISTLVSYGVIKDIKEANTNLSYLIKIFNNTRIWTDNGWTPIELQKNMRR